MNISSSTYHYDPKVSRAEQEEWAADIRGKVEQIRVTFQKAGYRMLLGYLRRDGINIGERRLRRVLKQSGLMMKRRRRYVRTTNSRHGFETHPNLIKVLKLNGINQVWVSDITYIRINNGFVYLAAILDLYSRKIVGYAISKKIDGELALSALKMAVARRNPKPGLIHHSDRGVQYLCELYTNELERIGIKKSCAAKGNPYENANAESFMKTLKVEEVDLRNYETYLDVIEKLPHFLEEVYNKRRIHSALGYVTPEEFEAGKKKN
jgi:putative transposase